MKALPLLAITVVQTAFCLAHWFMYATWIDFWWPLRPTTQSALAIAFALLSVIFIAATLLGFRFSNPFVKSFYWVAAIWIGFANFLLIAAILARLIDLVLLVLKINLRQNFGDARMRPLFSLKIFVNVNFGCQHLVKSD